MPKLEKLEKGNVYDVVLKYPQSLGGIKKTNLKLLGEFIGTSILRDYGDVITTHFNVKQEAPIDDEIHQSRMEEMLFYLFEDLEKNKVILSDEYISNVEVSGSDYNFKAINITVTQKMLLIRKMKELNIKVVEV